MSRRSSEFLEAEVAEAIPHFLNLLTEKSGKVASAICEELCAELTELKPGALLRSWYRWRSSQIVPTVSVICDIERVAQQKGWLPKEEVPPNVKSMLMAARSRLRTQLEGHAPESRRAFHRAVIQLMAERMRLQRSTAEVIPSLMKDFGDDLSSAIELWWDEDQLEANAVELALEEGKLLMYEPVKKVVTAMHDWERANVFPESERRELEMQLADERDLLEEAIAKDVKVQAANATGEMELGTVETADRPGPRRIRIFHPKGKPS
jgi:hypothetical protein